MYTKIISCYNLHTILFQYFDQDCTDQRLESINAPLTQ